MVVISSGLRITLLHAGSNQATWKKLKQPIADVVDVVTAVHAKSMKSISAANTNQKQFFGIKIVLFKDKST